MSSNPVCAQTPKRRTGRYALVAEALETRGQGRASLKPADPVEIEYTLNDLQMAQYYRIKAGEEPDPLKDEEAGS